jgi:hypothetical protein
LNLRQIQKQGPRLSAKRRLVGNRTSTRRIKISHSRMMPLPQGFASHPGIGSNRNAPPSGPTNADVNANGKSI